MALSNEAAHLAEAKADRKIRLWQLRQMLERRAEVDLQIEHAERTALAAQREETLVGMLESRDDIDLAIRALERIAARDLADIRAQGVAGRRISLLKFRAMRGVATSNPHTLLAPERELALAAIAKAPTDYHLAIRPRRAWHVDDTEARGVPIDAHAEDLSAELDKAVDTARDRFPLDRIWDVIAAESWEEADHGEWPAAWKLFSGVQQVGEFRVCLF